jgi:hypothetical protein
MEAQADQQYATPAGDGQGGYLLAWQGNRNDNWDIYGATPLGGVRVIEYTYDGLSRLTKASYSTGEQFEYQYDGVGHRRIEGTCARLSTWNHLRSRACFRISATSHNTDG